ncbi:hypothetical protein HK097_008463 [Rhizophlyctis rosea]|uniref:Uncharacterized protein n=1 Tax=Rhizophlyctis rosea TaxID=64517 RepID=A0AAD5SL17_9FUNG|nr:hypothetical protein HK097_008463 [Rhizophlyctis rosea]
MAPPTLANELSITCRPSPCPTTIPYTSTLTLVAEYTQTDPNITPQNITFSFYYRDTEATSLSREGTPISWQKQHSGAKSISFDIKPSTLNKTARGPLNATITTVIVFSELRLTDNNIIGARTVAGPSFGVTDIPRNTTTGGGASGNNATSLPPTSATPSATSSGTTGTSPTSSPSKVLVLSGANPRVWWNMTGWAAASLAAITFLAL